MRAKALVVREMAGILENVLKDLEDIYSREIGEIWTCFCQLSYPHTMSKLPKKMYKQFAKARCRWLWNYHS